MGYIKYAENKENKKTEEKFDYSIKTIVENAAKIYVDNNKELIDEKIEEEAVNLVTESIEKADEQIREEQQKMEEAIIKRAQELAEEHKHQMTNQLYKKTKEQINKRGRKPKTDKPVTTEEGK